MHETEELCLSVVVDSAQFLDKGQQVFVGGELRGGAVDGNQNPHVWTGNDDEPRASYEASDRPLRLKTHTAAAPRSPY
jgi:hypothetical protein